MQHHSAQRTARSTCHMVKEFDKPVTPNLAHSPLAMAPSLDAVFFLWRQLPLPCAPVCIRLVQANSELVQGRTRNSLSCPEIPSPRAPPTSRRVTTPPGGPSGAQTCWIDPLPRGVSTLGGPCPPRPLVLAVVALLSTTQSRTLLPTGPHTLCWLLSAASKHLMQPFL